MENPSPPPTPNEPPAEKRKLANSIAVGLIGIVSAIYLFNPTAGILELIPDNIPVIGNLDEAAAAAMLISALSYFGLDLGRLFGKGRKERQETTTIDAEVVDR